MALNEQAINVATAFLVHEKTIFYTDVAVDPTVSQPWTPLCALIEGIWNQNAEFTNKILRNHLYSFYPRTPLCDGMIKVAAKRARIMTELESYEFTEKLSDQTWVKVDPSYADQVNAAHADIGRTITVDEAVELAKKLALNSTRTEVLHESDRPVGGVLLSNKNEVLSLGWNTNATQRIHHCEVNLIRHYLKRTGKKIPAHSTLIITLKPCAMCAAQLFTFSEDISSLKVIYLEDDPGPAAANSILMKGSDLWVKAGKPVIQLASL